MTDIGAYNLCGHLASPSGFKLISCNFQLSMVDVDHLPRIYEEPDPYSRTLKDKGIL